MDSSRHDGLINPKSNDEESKQNLNKVINSMDKALGILHQLYLTVDSSYNDVSSQLSVVQGMNNVVVELDDMAKLGEKCNIQVPMEVLNLIDDGKNPDVFTRDVFKSCTAMNQITKGKSNAFKALRGHLLGENYGQL
ncbi:mediator of RNA polymerase II transcription subunit 10b-like [Lycium barbarum]|uniref:mediator of RNA polymerase II transcription subunit 10b-like n=1 Tax=Lycium barbarum TaxID=112863 RepID=UPI00293ECEC8|nr:mediator of RNA polymerase II transcription subunit 10b-like [Lycium barbarum]